MTAFISAGHYNGDSGAIGSGTQENVETIKFRDTIVPILKARGLHIITDNDNENLAEYLHRIQTGSGSVVLEFHFDSSGSGASGSTSLVGNDADRLDNAFAKELVDATSNCLGIPNRGVISEAQSHRGRLGLMREQGIVSLLEICFIDNQHDMDAYRKNCYELALKIAAIVCKYENIVM